MPSTRWRRAGRITSLLVRTKGRSGLPYAYEGNVVRLDYSQCPAGNLYAERIPPIQHPTQQVPDVFEAFQFHQFFCHAASPA